MTNIFYDWHKNRKSKKSVNFPVNKFLKVEYFTYLRAADFSLRYGITLQPAFSCSKLTIKTIEHGVKQVNS